MLTMAARRRRAARRRTARAPPVWRNAFIRMPYAMERLILRAVINDTFETAITWERFEQFHDAVKRATGNAIQCGDRAQG